MIIKRNILFEVILLELLCYVPLAIIAGNVLPPLGSLKFHWIYIGFVFLITVLVLIKNNRATGLFLLIVLFAAIQKAIAIEFSIKEFIDFISGPLLFIALVDTVCYSELQLETWRYYRKKFLIFAAVPIIIAILQFFKMIPLEILNANYVNITVFGSEKIERVNGYLFHGIELAVIIAFFFINLALLASNIKVYLLFLVMIVLEFITKIKSGILTSITYLGFFTYFIDERFKFVKTIVFTSFIIAGASFIYILVPDIKMQRFDFDPSNFKFKDQLFTGRGFIWNIYMKGIKQMSLGQVLFGFGYGSAPELFRQNSIGTIAFAKTAPGPHNQFLELFVNGGLFALWFMYFMLQNQYRKLKLLLNNHSLLFKYYWGIILIPLFIMGLTAPIMSMFVYWCGMSFVIISLKIKLYHA